MTTRSKKINRFLLGGTFFIGGLLALFFGTGLMSYIITVITAIGAVVLLINKESRKMGLVLLVIALLFASNAFWVWNIIKFLGIFSTLVGGYLLYDGYKKIQAT